MTFLELILGMEERGEKVVSEKPTIIITNQFSYQRIDSSWEQRPIPPEVDNTTQFLPLKETPKEPNDQKEPSSNTNGSSSHL